MAMLPKRKVEEHGPLMRFRREFDDLFDDFFSRVPAWPRDFGLGRGFPSVDVAESDKAVDVTAEVPGMTAEDLEISVTNNTLFLRGEKREVKEEKGQTVHRVERRYGRFERTVELPAAVEADKVEAECRDGVLTIHLPKKPEAQTRRVKIDVK